MTGAPSPFPFDLAATELRALGITLARLPGEYRVNFHNAGGVTARAVGRALKQLRGFRRAGRLAALRRRRWAKLLAMRRARLPPRG